MYIDTHCHLEKKYYEDIDKIIKENREAGIDRIIVSGCEKEEIKEVLEYAEKYDDVYLTGEMKACVPLTNGALMNTKVDEANIYE